MSKGKKSNSLSTFLGSKTGRKLFHILYSVGASIVIIGALAKIIHWPYGTLLLTIGMVTEAFVFFISAFDNDQVDHAEATAGGGVAVIGGGGVVGGTSSATGGNASTSGKSGGVIIAGGGGGYVGGGSGSGVAASSGGGGVIGGGNVVASTGGTVPVSGDVIAGGNILAEDAEAVSNAAKGMTDLGKVMTSLNEMSEKLLTSTDDVSGLTVNMKTLNENIANINSVYEAQFKTMSDQIGTIKYINDSLDRIKSLYDNTVFDSNVFKVENERMARQIQELNKVYARLLNAMNAGGGYNQGGGYPNQGGGYPNQGYNPNQGGGYNPEQGGGGYNPTL